MDWIRDVAYAADQIAEAFDDREVVDRCKHLQHRYLCSYAGVLSTLADESGRASVRGVAYRICSGACSLSTNDAVGSVEFQQSFFDVLSLIVNRVSDCVLRAHFCDVIWTHGRKCVKNPIDYARLFLQTVVNFPLTDEGWFGDQYNAFWNRAVHLSVALGAGVVQERALVFGALKAAYAKAVSEEDRLLAWALPHALHGNRVYDVVSPNVIAANYEKMAWNELLKGANTHAQTHFGAAEEWYGIAGCAADVSRMIAGAADACIKEAECEMAKPDVSYARGAAFYDMAIDAYIRIPKQDRLVLNVDARLDECKRKSDDAHNRSLGQMKSIDGPPVDISAEVARVRGCVRGKPFQKAVEALCQLYVFSEHDSDQYAKRMLNASVLSHIVGKTVLCGGSNARPVAAAAAVGVGNAETENRFDLEKVSAAVFLAQFAVEAQLYPAYVTIRDENPNVADDAFKSLVDMADLVPKNHKRMYAEALKLGFEGRFQLASYVLAPEVENLVREVLNQAGVITTSIQGGFQEEKGLSNLVKETKLVAIFGADFVFELRAIFCDHAGPNVRNVVAHGLKDDAWFDSVFDFYVWWFALRLVFMRKKPETNCRGANAEG